MALKIEKLKLDGTTYEIRELPVKVLLPLSNKLSEGSVESQLELLGASVAIDGKLLGAEAGEIGTSAYLKILKKVFEINGLNDDLGNAN